MSAKLDLKKCIRDIPDFPKAGILFKDITTLLKDKVAFNQALEELAAEYKDQNIDAVVAVEARGFILGGAIANKLGCGFVPVRKKGKLPAETSAVTYDLEYGKSTLEIHQDSIKAGEKVLVVDDVLATGGTMRATCNLVEKLGGKIIGVAILIDLASLKGKEKFKKYDYFSLVTYEK